MNMLSKRTVAKLHNVMLALHVLYVETEYGDYITAGELQKLIDLLEEDECAS